MKYRFWLFSVLLFAVTFASISDARAQTPAPLVLEERRNMRFGRWAADSSFGGTVTLSATTDAVISTGGITSFGGTIRRARIRITGEPRAFVFVTLPDSITIRRGGTGNIMTVDSFTMDRENPVRIGNNGRRNINIGATLHVGVNQRRGRYNDDNSFTVDVVYQ